MKEELVNKRGVSILFSVLAGGIVGAGIGLLLAPKSGKEIRNDIKDFADRTSEKVGKTIDEGVHFYEKGRNAVASALDCGKEAFEEKGERHLKSA